MRLDHNNLKHSLGPINAKLLTTRRGNESEIVDLSSGQVDEARLNSSVGH